MALTDLTGTRWRFGENVSIGSNADYSIDFNSNGASFNAMRLSAEEIDGFIYTTMSYNYDTVLSDGYFLNGYEEYRTIEIIGGTDATNPDLISFIQSNAEQLQNPKDQYKAKLSELANVINSKTGGTSPMTISQMIDAVRSL